MSWRAAFWLFLCVATSWAQQYVISTVAGGAPLPTPIAATTAPVGGISGVATDSAGNVYFSSANCVFKLDLFGNLTRVAGNSRAGYSGDGGPATSAQLSSPGGIAVDAVGNLFVGDRGNFRVRKISLSGGSSLTVAGGRSGQITFTPQGNPRLRRRFSFISGVAVDASGDLFISDSGYSAVRKISPNGIITTVAGSGTYGYSGDGGPAAHARLSNPYGLAIDTSGNIFIADAANNCVRKVATNGTITTLAGTGFGGFSGDGGLAINAQLADPQSVALDGSGNLFITDSGNYRIRKVSSNGVITTIAGNGTYGLMGDGGPASSAELINPADIAVDGSAGNIVIDESCRQFPGSANFSGVCQRYFRWVFMRSSLGVRHISVFRSLYPATVPAGFSRGAGKSLCGGTDRDQLRRHTGPVAYSALGDPPLNAKFGAPGYRCCRSTVPTQPLCFADSADN